MKTVLALAATLCLLATPRDSGAASDSPQWHLTTAGKDVRGVIDSPMPVYPILARIHKEEGRGAYQLEVRPNGTVASVAVLRSAGQTQLNVAAARALIRWRFQPGLYDKIRIPVTFQMLTRVNSNRRTILD